MRLESSCKIQFVGDDESGFGCAEFEMPVGHLSGNVQ